MERLPPNSSSWMSPEADRKLFKIRREFSYPLDKMACHYFHGLNYHNYERWLGTPGIEKILNVLEGLTSFVDTDENDLLFNEGFRFVSRQLLQKRSMKIDFKDDIKDSLDDTLDPIVENLLPGLRRWIFYLGCMLSEEPSELLEGAFQELFRAYLDVFDFACVNGSSVQLHHPHYPNEREPHCQPDLLFFTRHVPYMPVPYYGVVEVKKMAVDPAFKHYFKKPGKGILKTTDDCGEKPEDEMDFPDIPRERRRVTHQEEDIAEISERVEQICINLDDADSEASTSSVVLQQNKETVDAFFSQLFDQVLSLDHCEQLKKMKFDEGKRMGIGVVGFKIFFLAFYSKPCKSFGEVPDTEGAMATVHISRPLCILRATDRKEISIMLLQLAVCSQI